MENKNQLTEKVKLIIEKIRPYLQMDGGDIDFIELTDDNIVKVKLRGACGACPFSFQTLKSGVEMSIKKEIPDIKEVIAV